MQRPSPWKTLVKIIYNLPDQIGVLTEGWEFDQFCFRVTCCTGNAWGGRLYFASSSSFLPPPPRWLYFTLYILDGLKALLFIHAQCLLIWFGGLTFDFGLSMCRLGRCSAWGWWTRTNCARCWHFLGAALRRGTSWQPLR